MGDFSSCSSYRRRRKRRKTKTRLDTSEGRLAVWAKRSAACTHSGPGGQSNGVPLLDFTNLSGVRCLSFNRLRNTGSIADSSRRTDASSFRTMIQRARTNNDAGTSQTRMYTLHLRSRASARLTGKIVRGRLLIARPLCGLSNIYATLRRCLTAASRLLRGRWLRVIGNAFIMQLGQILCYPVFFTR
jgi:hypothetical protein